MREAVDHVLRCVKLLMLAFSFALGIRLALFCVEVLRLEMQSGGLVFRDMQITSVEQHAIAVTAPEAAP